MTELVVDDKNRVFGFDGSLGAQVWEPTPVTRFRFSKPVTNPVYLEWLSTNRPLCGVVFDGIPYVGTNDGFIDTPERRIQRVPEILVDKEIFLDEYLRNHPESVGAVAEFRRVGNNFPHDIRPDLLDEVLQLYEATVKVGAQEGNIDRYLNNSGGINFVSIIGLVVQKGGRFHDEPILYDGSALGIHETKSGKLVNALCPQSLYQISETNAGFVPSGDPFNPAVRFSIKNGVVTRQSAQCVDHRSLWSLCGRRMWVQNICPRDGSGCSAGRYATDGKVSAIVHGDGGSDLDIWVKNGGRQEFQRRVENCDPLRFIVRDGQVYGFHGEGGAVNYSTGERFFQGHSITSVADSGLCTTRAGSRTVVYDSFTHKPVDSLDGKFKFLSRVV